MYTLRSHRVALVIHVSIISNRISLRAHLRALTSVIRVNVSFVHNQMYKFTISSALVWCDEQRSIKWENSELE